ncbi:hypothetical protein EZV62_001440 [Acer yangbiense]|uniref:peptidylprolyl isomerase n=1 Tax=Acer yangbiense TaxID=1000413 RepID=A0A5C7IU67_9ROSI|nr:hypothetical protein EZV62_001440 [Acer yangbiense]
MIPYLGRSCLMILTSKLTSLHFILRLNRPPLPTSSVIVLLIKESDSNTAKLIKESEERQLSCFRAKLTRIREEIKVGETLSRKSTEEKSGTSNQKNDKDRDGEFLFEQVEKSDVQVDTIGNYTIMEESDGQAEVVAKFDGLASKSDVDKHSSDPWADAPADSKMVEDVDNQTILDENELKEINDCVQLCIEEMVQKPKPSIKKYIQQSIVNLKRRWDFLIEEMEAVRAIQEVQMSEYEKGNEEKEKMPNPRVFLDLNIGGQPAGRLVIELFSDSTPIIAENLRALCTGKKGIGKNGKPLHYKGTTFHRVIPRSMFNGGDITEGNRLRGKSIYGDSFTDENFINKHIGPEILSMANTSPGTNNSQFLIYTAKTEWLDGTNVVFGIVVEGFDVIKAIQKVGSISTLTSKPVMVTDCGQLS